MKSLEKRCQWLPKRNVAYSLSSRTSCPSRS